MTRNRIFVTLLLWCSGWLSALTLEKKAQDTLKPVDLLTDKPIMLIEENEAQLKPLLLVFWATWCKSCVHELALLTETLPEVSPVRVIGINLDTDKVKAKEVAQKVGLKIPTFNETSEFFQKEFSIQALPFSVLMVANPQNKHSYESKQIFDKGIHKEEFQALFSVATKTP